MDLPTDIVALRALLLASEERNVLKDGVIERKEDRIVRLEKLIADFKRALFGARSEKANPEQYELAFEDIETAMAAVHAEDEAIDPAKAPAKPRKTNRGSLPKHLPRIEEVVEPEDTACACGARRHIIGEDTSERLDIIPAQFRVIVTRRPKYACRFCKDGIVQAPAKARLIAGGLPTEATVGSVIVSKYADHLPLYRQSQIYARQGVEIDRSTLAGWVGKAAYELKPVYDCLKENLKQSTKLFMDETTVPVLDPGRGKVKKGYFWALAEMTGHGAAMRRPGSRSLTRLAVPVSMHQRYCRALTASCKWTDTQAITVCLIPKPMETFVWLIAGHMRDVSCSS